MFLGFLKERFPKAADVEFHGVFLAVRGETRSLTVAAL
jgi:hypothetical protein